MEHNGSEGMTPGQPNEAADKQTTEARKKEEKRRRESERRQASRVKKRAKGFRTLGCDVELEVLNNVGRLAQVYEGRSSEQPGAIVPDFLRDVFLGRKQAPSVFELLDEHWAKQEQGAPCTDGSPVPTYNTSDMGSASKSSFLIPGDSVLTPIEQIEQGDVEHRPRRRARQQQSDRFIGSKQDNSNAGDYLQSASLPPYSSFMDRDNRHDELLARYEVDTLSDQIQKAGADLGINGGEELPLEWLTFNGRERFKAGAAVGDFVATPPLLPASNLPDNLGQRTSEQPRTEPISDPGVSQRRLRQEPHRPPLSDRLKKKSPERRAIIIANMIRSSIPDRGEASTSGETIGHKIYKAVRRHTPGSNREGPSTDQGLMVNDIADVLVCSESEPDDELDRLEGLEQYLEEERERQPQHKALLSLLLEAVRALRECVFPSIDPDPVNRPPTGPSGQRDKDGDPPRQSGPFGRQGGCGSAKGPFDAPGAGSGGSPTKKSTAGGYQGISRTFISAHSSSGGVAGTGGNAPLCAAKPPRELLGGPKRNGETEKEFGTAGAGVEEGSGDNFATASGESGSAADDGGGSDSESDSEGESESESSSFGDRVHPLPKQDSTGGHDASGPFELFRKSAGLLDGTDAPRTFKKYSLSGVYNPKRNELIEEFGKDGYVYIVPEKRVGVAKFVDEEGAYYKTFQEVEDERFVRRTHSDSKAREILRLRLKSYRLKGAHVLPHSADACTKRLAGRTDLLEQLGNLILNR